MNKPKLYFSTILLRILFLPFVVPIFILGFLWEYAIRVFYNGRETFATAREMEWI